MCRTRPPAHPDPQLAPYPRPHPADSAVWQADAVTDLELRRHSTLLEEGAWLWNAALVGSTWPLRPVACSCG